MQLARRHIAHTCLLFQRGQFGQRLESGFDDVDRIVTAIALGEQVLDAGGLDDRAHAAPGDYASAGRGGDEPNLGSREHGLDLVRDRRPGERYMNDVTLRGLDPFADRLRHLAGFPHPDADVAFAVADDDHRAEAEASSALNHLRDSVDLDDALFEFKLIRVDSSACHNTSVYRSAVRSRQLLNS